MGEIRTNPIDGRRTIYAPARNDRPHDGHGDGDGGEGAAGFRDDCPFCPGQETELTEIVEETPGRGGQPWGTRVVYNRYPAAVGQGAEPAPAPAPFTVARGRGRHEVIIESPRHDRDLAQASRSEVEAVVEAYQRRYRSLTETGGFASVVVFRNRGFGAGASILHPHSQALALEERFPDDDERRARALAHHKTTGRCLVCDVIEAERRDGRRAVFETPGMLAVVPYAAAAPCEIWLLPLDHQAGFAAVGDAGKADLAEALPDALRRLERALGKPDYNFALLSDARPQGAEAALHWFLRVYPRPVVPGGFELGAGMAINPSLPEEDAARLRAAGESG